MDKNALNLTMVVVVVILLMVALGASGKGGDMATCQEHASFDRCHELLNN